MRLRASDAASASDYANATLPVKWGRRVTIGRASRSPDRIREPTGRLYRLPRGMGTASIRAVTANVPSLLVAASGTLSGRHERAGSVPATASPFSDRHQRPRPSNRRAGHRHSPTRAASGTGPRTHGRGASPAEHQRDGEAHGQDGRTAGATGAPRSHRSPSRLRSGRPRSFGSPPAAPTRSARSIPCCMSCPSHAPPDEEARRTTTRTDAFGSRHAQPHQHSRELAARRTATPLPLRIARVPIVAR